MSQWFKYDFVCPYCDGLFSYTITKFSVDYWKCPNCDELLALMSVVDATIPDNQKEGGI